MPNTFEDLAPKSLKNVCLKIYSEIWLNVFNGNYVLAKQHKVQSDPGLKS